MEHLIHKADGSLTPDDPFIIPGTKIRYKSGVSGIMTYGLITQEAIAHGIRDKYRPFEDLVWAQFQVSRDHPTPDGPWKVSPTCTNRSHTEVVSLGEANT